MIVGNDDHSKNALMVAVDAETLVDSDTSQTMESIIKTVSV